MLKKIIFIFTLIFILNSCSNNVQENQNTKTNEKITCENPYKIWEAAKQNLKLKWVVVSDDTKTVSSPMAWTVTYLNCEAWKKVYPKTLIARIAPDYNNPSIANLSIQKSSLVSQKANIESLKQTTISNFDNQIADLKWQIEIVKKNIELTKKSSNLSKLDLEKQIESLEETLKSLENNLKLLKKAKKDALEKIDISRDNLYSKIKSISLDNLLKIDEIFGITDENKDLNDKYEDYLWTENSILLNSVKNQFKKLNEEIKNYDQMSDSEISEFLGKLKNLDDDAKESVKESIANVYFPQTQIDSFYSLFLNFSNNISDLKNSWDSLDNSKSSTNSNFDTQISSLENQIETTKTNLENLKTNKVLSVDTWLELQLAQLDSQLKTLQTNLDNLKSQKKSQIINFDNQILQLNQSIASLNSSLAIRNVYAWITWVVKQKLSSKWNNIWPNMPLCQIIPNAKSTKIKIYSPVELDIWDKLTFELNWKTYEVIIENALIYKDAITQNYVYESNYLDRKYFKDWEIVSLKYENEKEKIEQNENLKWDIKIPVSYVKNKIDWNYVKAKTWSWIVDKKVELWEINWNYVKVKKWAEWVLEICK